MCYRPELLVVVLVWAAVLVFAPSCTPERPDDSRPTQGNGGAAVDEVVQMLVDMPAWGSFSVYGDYGEEEAEIERVARAIAAYDLDVIRAAFQRYGDQEWAEPGGAGMWADTKLYVLNKFLFDLPETVRRDSPHFRPFGGWGGLPITGDPLQPDPSDEMSMRWPWSEDESGTWRLTGRYGGSMGPPYLAMEAFDFYRKEFGRREVSE